MGHQNHVWSVSQRAEGSVILTTETESECSCCHFSLVIYLLEPQSIPVYNCDSIPINLLGEVLENLSSILFCKPLFIF